GLEAAVVPAKRFRLAVLQVKLAVVRPVERVLDQPLQAGPVQAGTLVEQGIGGGEMGHRLDLVASCWKRAVVGSQHDMAAAAARCAPQGAALLSLAWAGGLAD